MNVSAVYVFEFGIFNIISNAFWTTIRYPTVYFPHSRCYPYFLKYFYSDVILDRYFENKISDLMIWIVLQIIMLNYCPNVYKIQTLIVVGRTLFHISVRHVAKSRLDHKYTNAITAYTLSDHGDQLSLYKQLCVKKNNWYYDEHWSNYIQWKKEILLTDGSHFAIKFVVLYIVDKVVVNWCFSIVT